MSKIVPFKDIYDLVKKINCFSSILLYVSTIVVLLTFIVDNTTDLFEEVINYALKTNCIIIIAYILLDLLKDYLLFGARKKKRLDFIDNSLGSTMTTDHSNEYYSNKEIQPGIYKMAVNSFENTLFSLNLSKSMIPKTLIINIIVLFIFLASAIYGIDNLVVLIVQLVLPAVMLKQIVKLLMLVINLDVVYQKYCTLFNGLLSGSKIENKFPEMISNVLEYETILSWGSVLISEEKYKAMNHTLTSKWAEIKKNYNITKQL